MKTIDKAIEEAMPDPNWFIEENNDTSGEEAYNSIQMENMFKSGVEYMKQQCIERLSDVLNLDQTYLRELLTEEEWL